MSRPYDKDFVGGAEWTTEIKNNSNKTIKLEFMDGEVIEISSNEYSDIFDIFFINFL